jgi:predicted RNA-binding protein YlqC (UPF0109 family)
VKELVEFLVRPLVEDQDAMSVSIVEGSASTLIELRVSDADLESLQNADNADFLAVQQVLAAAGGRRKPILELIDPSDDSEEE